MAKISTVTEGGVRCRLRMTADLDFGSGLSRRRTYIRETRLAAAPGPRSRVYDPRGSGPFEVEDGFAVSSVVPEGDGGLLVELEDFFTYLDGDTVEGCLVQQDEFMAGGGFSPAGQWSECHSKG